MYTQVIFLLAVLYAQSVYSSHYHGPTAIPHVLHNGYLADTHEVAAAKNAHLAALAKYSHGYSYGHSQDETEHGDLRYHGPTAIPHILHDGHIADTHEVAAAKAEHFAAVAKAKAHTYGGEYEGDHSGRYSEEHNGYLGHAVPYHDFLVKPIVLNSGYLPDTHEVEAAKEHHTESLHSSYQGQHDDTHY